ncbi:MAG: hypothetical protein AAF481_15090 [Acidobacteriota bacterium]
MSILSDAVEALDPTPDRKTELTLALNLLTELAKSNVKAFEAEVDLSHRTAGTPENKTAPITTVVARHSEYRAYVKEDVAKIAEEVASAIKKFVSGEPDAIIAGMGDLVTTAMESLLGSGEAIEESFQSYYVTVQSRALVRYDICAWRRTVEATGITSQIERASAIFACKASVDVGALDLNTFLLAYQDQLSMMGFPRDETLKYIDEAEKVYQKLKGESSSSGSLERIAAITPSGLRPSRPGQIVFTSSL